MLRLKRINTFRHTYLRTSICIVLGLMFCTHPITAQSQRQRQNQELAQQRHDRNTSQQNKSYDSEQLGKALDYFSGNKYHEALNIFEKLDKKYKLNQRFRAYMGICYYYEWDYKNACKYMEEALPHLEAFSPHERSIYYHITAESYFNLEEYEKAIPLYEQQLTVCYENEKADAYYRIGFCYMQKNDWHNAKDFFDSALKYYERYSDKTAAISARTTQIQKMISGIDKIIAEKDSEQ